MSSDEEASARRTRLRDSDTESENFCENVVSLTQNEAEEDRTLRTGRKRTAVVCLQSRNVNKKRRNKGQSYTNTSGKKVAEKTFTRVDTCCKKNCSKSVTRNIQARVFESFWTLGDFEKQNLFLHSIITAKEPVVHRSNAVKPKTISWQYTITSPALQPMQVCKQFLLSVLQISKGRMERIQKKIQRNESLADNRGKHLNHPTLLSDEMKALIQEHCESIPHKDSHYSRQDTKLKYFLNPNLSLQKMKDLFCEYYEAQKGAQCRLSLSTYSKYFNKYVGYSFKEPRSDVCNVCYEKEVQKIESHDYLLHKAKIAECENFKMKLLSEERSLVLEFDYSQNLPLPKLPVNEQFYCRLLWMFVFNVHIHKQNTSFMFHFLEGIAKKGASSVCSFLRYAIQQSFVPRQHKKIVLFSDACGGQNRNYIVFSFLVLLARELNVTIVQVFPVRGHSYNICDRNFGHYSQKLKTIETIEQADEYVDVIRTARTASFTMVDAEKKALMLDYDTGLKKIVTKPKSFKISEAVVIIYNNTGVQVSSHYDMSALKTFPLLVKKKLAELTIPPAPYVGISKEKKTDVTKLLRYVSDDGCSFFQNHFNKLERSDQNEEQSESSD